jgi:NTP pyrophosphatase (non-canonical NTP hydrolase)
MTDWKAEAELLRAQLVQCTRSMRKVSEALKDEYGEVPNSWLCRLAVELDFARSAPVSQYEHELHVTVHAYECQVSALRHEIEVLKKNNSFDFYENETERTAAGGPSAEMTVAILALGLCGEAGEVSELVKKSLGHGVPFEKEKLKKELGDVLWYLTRLGALHNIHLTDIAKANVEKLRARYPDGFVAGGGIR